jgi:hypothetical protein
MAPESSQSIREMSTRNLPGCKGQLAYKADNLTTICEPSQPVTGITLPFLFLGIERIFSTKLVFSLIAISYTSKYLTVH